MPIKSLPLALLAGVAIAAVVAFAVTRRGGSRHHGISWDEIDNLNERELEILVSQVPQPAVKGDKVN